MSKSTLLEQSVLEDGNVYFIEKTMRIIGYKSNSIHEHKNEVQEVSKDLNQQIDELEAIVASLVNLDTSIKESLSLDKIKDKWRSQFEEVMQKGDDGEDSLLDRFMDIKEEVKVARREVIKLKEVQGLVSAELERIKFEDDWLDGPNSDTLQQVFSSYDEYILEHATQN